MDISEVKKSLGHNVKYNDSNQFRLTGCIIRKNEKTGKFFYQAELEDLKSGRCLVYCRLEDIENIHDKENKNEL